MFRVIFAQPLIPKDFSFFFSIVDKFSFVFSGKIEYLFELFQQRKDTMYAVATF